MNIKIHYKTVEILTKRAISTSKKELELKVNRWCFLPFLRKRFLRRYFSTKEKLEKILQRKWYDELVNITEEELILIAKLIDIENTKYLPILRKLNKQEKSNFGKLNESRSNGSSGNCPAVR